MASAAPAPAAGYYSTWRVLVHSSAQPNAAQGAAYVNIAELIFAATVGGPTLATGGAAKASSEYDSGAVVANAFDGNPDTFWNSGATPPPDQWIQYTFTSAVSLAEVRIQARTGQYGAWQLPGVWDLQGSNDGGATLTTVQSYTSPTWTPGQTQAFAVAAPAPAPAVIIVSRNFAMLMT